MQREANQRKEERDRTLRVYQEYQENTKTSSQIQTEILKGVQTGEDIYELFLKAAKAISLMTSNRLFYSQLEADIKSIYGEGLLEPQATELEIQDTMGRLERLETALERELEADSRGRIERAVIAHRRKIKDLEELTRARSNKKLSLASTASPTRCNSSDRRTGESPL